MATNLFTVIGKCTSAGRFELLPETCNNTAALYHSFPGGTVLIPYVTCAEGHRVKLAFESRSHVTVLVDWKFL